MSDKTLLTIVISLFVGITIGTLWLDAVQDNVWNCAAKDEVVVIDNTCRHIDELMQ